MTGDFNYDLSKGDHSKVSEIENNFLLTQIINKPTHVTPSSQTIIDHIYINNYMIPSCYGVLPISISDHYPVFVVLPVKTKSISHKIITKQFFKNFNQDNFVQDLLYSSVQNNLYNIEEVEPAWTAFKTEFLRISDIHAPIHTYRVKNSNNTWINNDILELIYKRNHLHKIAVKTNNPDKWNEYRTIRNKITNTIRKTKKSYYKTKIETVDNNPKSIWNLLKQVLPSNKYTSHKPTITAQTFNDLFSTVGEKLTSNFSDSTLPDCHISTPEVPFSFLCIDSNFVLKELLKLSKESKLDILQFDDKLLRFASLIISPYLAHIFNLSLCTGFLPQDWKLARITPIYKGKNDKCDPTNYRPISVVSPIAKILEKAVKSQLIDYLIHHKLLSTSQSAYLKYHSTQTALHYLTDHFYSNINSGKTGIACFLDLSKGFDTLNTDILLHKLNKHGINYEITWFESYLTNRKQIQ